MSEFKKRVGKLIVYWTPEDDMTQYTFSLSYLEDFFVKNQVLKRQRPEFPISYIPENNPPGKYSGRLFMNLNDNSLNISLSSPEVIKEKLYPPGNGHDKPSKEKKDYLMNLEKLNYKQLFPYIYIQPWPNASKSDIENNFAECCSEAPLNFSEDITSCKNKNNSFYNKLTELKSKGDRPGMEKQSVYYINGYNDNKEPVYENEYISNLSSLNPFFKNVFNLGVDLRSKEKVTFEELTEEVNKYFDSWGNLKKDLKQPANKNEQVKIVMSYIALMITFGYNFEWMSDLQLIIISISLLYKALQYADNEETSSAENEKPSEGDSTIPTPEVINNWIYSTIILPDDVFPLPTIKEENNEEESPSKVEFVKPYSLGTLKMVQYRLLKYRLGEVSKIESVLKGETKTVKERKLDRVEHETEFDKEDVITWKEALDESFSGSENSYDKTLKQRTSTTTYNDGSTASSGETATDNGTGGTIGGWTVDENPAGGSQKDENAFAKDIINRAAQIITQKVGFSRLSKHLHEHEENVIHQYNNENGEEDIIGIYRWINKIYKFKNIEYGNRVMLQIYCTNPAEYYLKNEFQFYHVRDEYRPDEIHINEIKTLEQLGVKTFADISETPQGKNKNGNEDNGGSDNKKYYLDLLEYYKISHFPSPPDAGYHIEKNIEGVMPQEYSTLIIPFEYTPVKASVNAELTDKVTQITVKIGEQEKVINNTGSVNYDLSPADLNGNKLPIYINATLKENKNDDSESSGGNTTKENVELLYTASLNITAGLKENVLNEWKYRIYILLKKGYRKKLKKYYHLVNYRRQTLSSGNAQLNNDIVLQQLKNKCIEVLKNHYTKIINGGIIDPGETDKTDIQNLIIGDPTFLQFIEHGIEWDKLTYYLYPEFENPALYANHTIEQNFSSFLRSKSARILVPVKNDYEFSFLFSLSTGWLWPGKDIDSPAVLSNINIFNEIKNMEWAKEETEKESWEVTIPTSLTMLQKGSGLPEFDGEDNG
ncbi:MAG: hypothetical protein PVH88_20350 [Ignavibacteria bacterium]|jgi:hypothetical protein